MAPTTPPRLAVILLALACGAPLHSLARSFATSGDLAIAGFNATHRYGRRLQQLPKSASAQIFLDGPLEEATMNASCTNSPLCGGTLTVQGELVTVPANMMVMFPANALTWQEVFTYGPAVGAVSGLALNDVGRTTTNTYHVSVTANRVGASGQIIAALIEISPSPVTSGAGYIDSIDYASGTLTIESNNGAPGAKVRINDPTGRFGMARPSPQDPAGMDPRFCVDPDNPTIHSVTGFPMCIPYADPNTDTSCPQANRPLDSTSPTFKPLTIINAPADPTKSAPFMVGDYITFAGIRAVDPATQESFIAAYEIVNNVAIYTAPGSDPAYVVFETALIGTGGLNALGVGEAAVRSRFEGFTTDPSRPVQLFAVDFDPANGNPSYRKYGEVIPDPGPPTGAVRGRWRFRPPCTTVPVGGAAGGLVAGADLFQGNKGCTAPPAGVYTPPPREVMIQVQGCDPTKVPQVSDRQLKPHPMGCFYRNPTIEYIWPENIPGTPIVENNFQVVPFLAAGGYTSSLGTIVKTLSPWPSNMPAPDLCSLLTSFDTGGPYSVTNNGALTLFSTVAGPSPYYTYSWAADPVPATLAGAQPGSCGTTCSQPQAVFSGVSAGTLSIPPTGITLTYTLTVTDACGHPTAKQATVKIVAPPTSAITAIPPQTIKSGTTVTLTATLSGTNPTAATFTWTPANFNGQAIPPTAASIPNLAQGSTSGTFTTSSTSTTSTFVFTAPSVNAVTILPFSVTATSGATVSDSVTVPVTVVPSANQITITAVAFRCDKHRMSITVTSNSNNLQLTLPTYTDNSGKLFNPYTLLNGLPFSNAGTAAGVTTYTLTIEPVPLPSTTMVGMTVISTSAGIAAGDAWQMNMARDVKGTCTI